MSGIRAIPLAPTAATTIVWLYTHNAHAFLNQSFIYQPISFSLQRGLTALGFDARHRVVRSHGGSTARVDMLNVTRCGDALIFVGEIAGYADHVPWKELRRRGVRTILYNTEPRNVAKVDGVHSGCWWPPSADIDEVWDYALSNVIAAQRCNSGWLQDGTKHRHVPPGFSPPPLTARIAREVSVKAPILFGNARSRRIGCLQSLMAPPVGAIAIRNVWSDAALADLLEHSVLFLNVHKDSAYGTVHGHQLASKTCAQPTMPLEAVRVAQLLSAGGALIISERANSVDEALYHGIIEFVPYEQLHVVLRRWLAAGVIAIRRAAMMARQRFRERFMPADILRRSNATLRFTEPGERTTALRCVRHQQ